MTQLDSQYYSCHLDQLHICLIHFYVYIHKIQQDATVYRYLFTAKSLYMFRVSIAPIIRST